MLRLRDTHRLFSFPQRKCANTIAKARGRKGRGWLVVLSLSLSLSLSLCETLLFDPSPSPSELVAGFRISFLKNKNKNKVSFAFVVSTILTVGGNAYDAVILASVGTCHDVDKTKDKRKETRHDIRQKQRGMERDEGISISRRRQDKKLSAFSSNPHSFFVALHFFSWKYGGIITFWTHLNTSSTSYHTARA
jgi:hypothetical protein